MGFITNKILKLPTNSNSINRISMNNIPDINIPISSFGLEDFYERIVESGSENSDFIGQGGTATVYLMRDKSTNRLVAVKVFESYDITDPERIESIQREIIIQSFLSEGNYNIVKTFELVYAKTHLCLILEYAEKGSLCDYIENRMAKLEDGFQGLIMNEDEVPYFYSQILNSVELCHNSNVMHRDLKPDNILLDNSNPPVIKLCDFGFANMWGRGKHARSQTGCGTLVYMSPEMLNCRLKGGNYNGKSADIWSLGIILFILLVGFFPYNSTESSRARGDSNQEAKQIAKSHRIYTWKDCVYAKDEERARIDMISTAYQNILDRILTFESKKRITLKELKKFPCYMRKQSINQDKKSYRNKSIHKILNGILIRSNESKRRSILMKTFFSDIIKSQTPKSDNEGLTDYYLISTGKVRRFNLNADTY